MPKSKSKSKEKTHSKPKEMIPRNVHDFSLVNKAKTFSSMRTKALNNQIKREVQREDRALSNHSRRRTRKKRIKLDSLHEFVPNPSNFKTPEQANGKRYSYEPEGLDIIDMEVGAVHWLNKDRQVFGFVKCPRDSTLERNNEETAKKSVAVLSDLQKTGVNCVRGARKTGTSTCGAKYTNAGFKPNRGGRGLVETKELPEGFDCMVNRIWSVAREYVGTAWIRAASLIDGAFPTVGKCPLHATVASSVDYSAPAHVDDDFLFSIHQINVDGDGYMTMEAEVVQYFCFPEYGYCVALRPGDILLFNPQISHCLSEKTPFYSDVRVHVTTLYLKTALVGGRNNLLPLTAEQNYYYYMEV